MTRVLLVVALGLLAAPAEAQRFIPPGQEPAVLAMLGGTPAGCTLAGVSIDRDRVDARFDCEGTTREVVLVHASARPDVVRAGSFAIVTEDAALAEALRSSIETDGAGFRWIEPVPRAGEPPREGEPREAEDWARTVRPAPRPTQPDFAGAGRRQHALTGALVVLAAIGLGLWITWARPRGRTSG